MKKSFLSFILILIANLLFAKSDSLTLINSNNNLFKRNEVFLSYSPVFVVGGNAKFIFSKNYNFGITYFRNFSNRNSLGIGLFLSSEAEVIQRGLTFASDYNPITKTFTNSYDYYCSYKKIEIPILFKHYFFASHKIKIALQIGSALDFMFGSHSFLYDSKNVESRVKDLTADIDNPFFVKGIVALPLEYLCCKNFKVFIQPEFQQVFSKKTLPIKHSILGCRIGVGYKF